MIGSSHMLLFGERIVPMNARPRGTGNDPKHRLRTSHSTWWDVFDLLSIVPISVCAPNTPP